MDLSTVDGILSSPVTGLESKQLFEGDWSALAKAMGLFLQKTNITRDYLEDITAPAPRMFYPKAIWGKYVKKLEELKDPAIRDKAVQCLNEMITNAFQHTVDCIRYMERLNHPEIFAFCAIPQTMAISTMALCYNNGRVFETEVKIPKGEAVHLMLTSKTLNQVLHHFKHYALLTLREIPKSDPNADRLRQTLRRLIDYINSHPKYQ